MTPKELHEKVAKIADTDARMSHVTASDVSRTIKKTFEIISTLPAAEAMALCAKMTNAAAQSRAKARAAGKKAKPKKGKR